MSTPETETDVVERLREPIVGNAFAAREIVNGMLAERLARERGDAADEIERLRSEVDHWSSLATVDLLRTTEHNILIREIRSVSRQKPMWSSLIGRLEELQTVFEPVEVAP